MRRPDSPSWPTLLLSLPLVLALACRGSTAPTESRGTGERPIAGGPASDARGATTPFADAQVFFELNTTADDLGLQVFLDATGWKQVTVADPGGSQIVQLTADGNLSELGITELRFESAEPSPEEVLARFPPGTYDFRGKTVDGTPLASRAPLSHDFLPAPRFRPTNGQVVDPKNVTVTWSAPGAELVEVIVQHAELGHSFDVILSGATTQLAVPPQFLRSGEEYKIEVLAIGRNRNRTIAEGHFLTKP